MTEWPLYIQIVAGGMFALGGATFIAAALILIKILQPRVDRLKVEQARLKAEQARFDKKGSIR